MFQFKGRSNKEYGLGWTHEEVITPLVKKFVTSYKDLPLYLYQIQDKFRNEPRAKAGLLRGIEFSMKDLYSFHRDEKDLNNYYQKVLTAYQKIFSRCGLEALVTEAAGGSFSKYSHEFQVLAPNGEDVIYYCAKCHYAQNQEIAEIKKNDLCPKCRQGKILLGKAVEVGNIFSLKTKYSQPFKLEFIDQAGKHQSVLMGCYGIGPSRIMGTVVEIHHDNHGIIWPKNLSPFTVHLLPIGQEKEIKKKANQIYQQLLNQGLEVLLDDRSEATAGQKFAEADLIGITYRLVVSAKTKDKIEFKARNKKVATLINDKELLKKLAP
jgi:prolyl-tRNA synthetase